VCFSPQVDVVAGVVVTGIGIDAYRHLHGRADHLLLATLPSLLGVHQLIETFVWLDLEGHVSHQVGRIALWAYLLIAFVVLPVFVPLAVRAMEPTRGRRSRIVPFVVIGAIVSIVLLRSLIRGPISATLHPWHIAYNVRISYGLIVVMLYIIAICGPLLLSGYRHVMWFGLGNLIAVVALAFSTRNGFASLWCVYAAISAGAIAAHMRYAKPHRAAPYELT
jgi:hypothetical protein